MDQVKMARVSWTTERNGKATRKSKEMKANKVEAFVEKLAEKDAFQVDVVWEA